ncbi:MAG: proton-conducting transporter membrane subunit [Lachnospiraceae bacterium]|nr:proton-conducting transporter membrane subunit [Lachnospiraceae bacterium]
MKKSYQITANIITGAAFALCGLLAIRMLTGSSGGLTFEIPYVCGLGLHFQTDGFRALYGAIAAFMWFMATLFSGEYFTRHEKMEPGHDHHLGRYYVFLLVTLVATEGVFFSADFFTTFVFFEIMSFTSYVWVAQDEKPESLRAGATYLAVAVIGGLVMLMGIFLLYDVTGTLFFDDLVKAYVNYGLVHSHRVFIYKIWAAGLCLLFGFGAKAGAFPLHIWLPKAHPVAPAPASALLSGILTKAGMFGILILTSYLFLGNALWGGLILMLGVLTMIVGAVLAIFSIDLKRTLACSSVSQIGFILVGVGMSGLLAEENALALRGSLLHMVNHSLLKLVLFMAAGVVFMNAHKLDLNDIRGFGRKKPLLHYIFLMGVLGIGGMPLWNGYVSKTLIHESIVEYIAAINAGILPALIGTSFMRAVEWIFLISGGLTVAYMLKLYICLFWEKNADAAVQKRYDDLQGSYMNKTSAFALTLSTTLLPIGGFLPNIVMDRLADMGQTFLHASESEQIAYFSVTNLRGALISLIIGGLLYVCFVRTLLRKKSADGAKIYYVNRWPAWLDLENLIYRPLLLEILPFTLGMICRFLDSLVDTVVVALRKTVYRDEKLPHERFEGTVLTHLCACIAGAIQALLNHTLLKKHPKHTDYEHKLALMQEEFNENTTLIARSMSFGLLLFCVGLILTVAYLFVKDVFGL